MAAFIKSLLGYVQHINRPEQKQVYTGQSPAATGSRKVGSAFDLTQACPIQYVYDPVPGTPPYLNPLQKKFPRHARKDIDSVVHLNSIELDPLVAGLPYRSSLSHVRVNKFWKLNLSETVKFLELFAADISAADVEVKQGITLAKLAKNELRPGIEHRIMRATPHMFPSASQERIQHISALMLMYFVFDDKAEETPDEVLHQFREDFLSRFSRHHSKGSTTSELQHQIDSVVRSIQEEDAMAGNGGEEMIEALRGAFRCVHAAEHFQTVNDYLEFRRSNVGASFVIAAAKYAIRSSVDSSDPRFEKFLKLISDHLGLINDLASYDKEFRAVESGRATDMINLVAVMKTLLSLPTNDAAKVATYEYQLQVESWIMQEIEHLDAHENLSEEEWCFVEAVLLTATGNVFWCMTSSRYGGEAARIKSVTGIE